MPDNANAPGTATTSGGSSGTTGSTTPAADPSLKDILATVKTLTETFTKKSSEWDNLRSLHDRQMTEIRQAMAGKGGGGTRKEDDDGEGAAAASTAGGPRPISARELAAQRDNAIIKFRMEHPDWNEYWKDIEAIGSDAAKARPFVRYMSDPETGELLPDFYASLVDIRSHLELQRLRTAQAEANPASKQAKLDKGQARADAGAIGGSAASIPSDALGPDYQKLPYNEKVKRLVELGVIEVDPNDPPEALR
jgi:hypothetical protein